MRAWKLLVFAACLCWALPAVAITIDDFEEGEMFLSPSANSSSLPTVVGSSTAVGGFRKLTVTNIGTTQGAVEGAVYEASGTFAHSQAAQKNGRSVLRWDGQNSISEGVFADAIDLLHDGSEKFVLRLKEVDQETSLVKITVIDRDSLSKTASVTKTLPRLIAPADFEIPFADLIASSGTPEEILSNLGGVILEFDGSNVIALDLVLDWFGTDGCTERIPTHGMNVYDDCGDCEGGNAAKDVCGICDGDGQSCLDCENVPFGDKEEDLCGDCGGTNECLDCEGTVDGFLEYDSCGICGGDGTSCLDCEGTPFGELVLDECGECGGDGKSCYDCAGQKFGDAKIDRCGVCAGDGNSCLECTEYDIREKQFVLDGYAKQQEKVIKRLLRTLKRIDDDGIYTSFIRKTASKAHELQLSNWTLSWTLPGIFSECQNQTFCVSSSNEPVLTSYRDQSGQLLKLTKKTTARIKRIKGNLDRAEIKLRKQGKLLYDDSIALSETVPLMVSSCS